MPNNCPNFYHCNAPIIKISKDEKIKFFKKIKQETANKCWEWSGNKNNKGYGTIFIAGKKRYAHRVSYIISFGNIPNGMCVCHKCDNPICVNPYHLFLGTQKDNMADCYRKGRNKQFSFPGCKNGNAKLTEKSILKILNMLKTSGLSQTKIGKIFGVSHAVISKIKLGKSYINESNKTKKSMFEI